MLRADNLIAGYLPGVNILNGADLYCQQGELVGIIGPNGAGKSTLLKALFGLVKVKSGTVLLEERDITNRRADALVAAGIGFVPQTNNVFPSLTVQENLEMGVFQNPKSFSKRFDFVTDLFPALRDRRGQRAGSLSGGERQMVAMGRALMMEPSVLLLDEPSAGLSPVMQDEVFVQTRRINRAGSPWSWSSRTPPACRSATAATCWTRAATRTRAPGASSRTTRRSSSSTWAPWPRADARTTSPVPSLRGRASRMSGRQARAVRA